MSAAASLHASQPASPVSARVADLDWARIEQDLDTQGWSSAGQLLEAERCGTLIDAYADTKRFRSRIVMARHNFGRGEYQYFRYPLPAPVEALRTALYARLAPIANRWMGHLGHPTRYPDSLGALLARCRQTGQHRPTPLMLRYGPGDYNCLHQDVYGDCLFPLQVAILLSDPETDFTGGQLVLTEQRPRMQSRVHVVEPERGTGVIFAVDQRPVQGARGYYRVRMRHGVSTVRHGLRHVLGIIFHDAA